MSDAIWSNTDFPYACLIDKKRTEAFKEAIHKVVRPGNTVIDIGSGTGILALFAAEAGSAKVIAVEIEPLLASCLRETIDASRYKDVIEVIEANALVADLPKNVDVVIAELVETGLMDEMQVPVINALHKQGVIGSNTSVIPQAYQTNIELVYNNVNFYGHPIKAPMHMWPYYSSAKEGWWPVEVTSVSDSVRVVEVDFRRINTQEVDKTLKFKIVVNDKPVNAVRISGLLTLADEIKLRDTNTINGEKVVFLPNEVSTKSNLISMRISYKMGGGLGSFRAQTA